MCVCVCVCLVDTKVTTTNTEQRKHVFMLALSTFQNSKTHSDFYVFFFLNDNLFIQ